MPTSQDVPTPQCFWKFCWSSTLWTVDRESRFFLDLLAFVGLWCVIFRGTFWWNRYFSKEKHEEEEEEEEEEKEEEKEEQEEEEVKGSTDDPLPSEVSGDIWSGTKQGARCQRILSPKKAMLCNRSLPTLQYQHCPRDVNRRFLGT